MAKKKEMVKEYQEKKATKLTWLMSAMGLSNNAWYHVAKDNTEKDQSVLEKVREVLSGEFHYYGYRKVTEELKRQGEAWNHKRILRIMGEYLLIQPRKKKRDPKTTNSNHQYTVYTNEIKYLSPVLLPSTVWVADITYVWVGDNWAYVAIVLDQGSRKVVGWSISRSLERGLCIDALNMALEDNKAPTYHHSDRGVQYCSHDYQKILKDHNITPSMADVGISVDNPHAESFNKSLKVEEVYYQAYETMIEARESILEYIECYNTRRLHSSIGYVPPLEYEMNCLQAGLLKV